VAGIAEGRKAPAFTLADGSGKRVSLADFKGKDVVVYFYPKDDTPGCTKEACGFRDLWRDLRRAGVVVLGISGDDDAETLRAFASEWKINYPMIVGRDEVALMDAYGPIYGYPISVIVGRDGALCGKHVGPATKEEFEREIKALL
jgi:peroxiredoxin Q/BCP